jgi:hypothetical protein
VLLLSFSVCKAEVTQYQMGDDGYTQVPIPFAFPYQGKVFTNSWMFDNGVVGFMDPTGGYNGAQNWDSKPLNQVGPQFSYMIFPMWSDIAPTNATKYIVNSSESSQTYTWQNISEYYSGGSRLNTFNLEIRPDGYFGATYDKINMQTSNVSIGYTGDVTKGEYTQISYHNFGTVLNQLQSWNGNGTVNLCASNPLSDPSCPGYAEAYFQQQCSVNVFYNASCPGYTEAYHSYMCSQDPLYDMTCPGYESAYFQYRCSLDVFYSTSCTGYQQAYYLQQCSLNPLYDSGCIGYQQAYEEKQFNNACLANPQYSVQCPGYKVIVSNVTENNVSQPVTIVDAVIDNVISTPNTTSPTSVSPASVTSVLQPQQNSVTQSSILVAPAPVERKETKSETKQEVKTDSKPVSTSRAAAVESVKQKQIETAKNLANTLGEVKTQEAQAAAQNAVMATMGYVPGFDSYSGTITEIDFYKTRSLYKNQRTIDNNRFLMQLQNSSNKKHDELTTQQYKKE